MIRRIIKEQTSEGYTNEATELAVLYITNERELYNIFSKKNNTEHDVKQYFSMLKRLNKDGYDEIMEIVNPTPTYKGGPGPNRKYISQQTINWKEVAEELNNRN